MMRVNLEIELYRRGFRPGSDHILGRTIDFPEVPEDVILEIWSTEYPESRVDVDFKWDRLRFERLEAMRNHSRLIGPVQQLER